MFSLLSLLAPMGVMGGQGRDSLPALQPLLRILKRLEERSLLLGGYLCRLVGWRQLLADENLTASWRIQGGVQSSSVEEGALVA